MRLHYILFFALILGFSSCDSFLDEEPTGNFTTGSYYTKPEHAQAAVNGIYPFLRNLTNGSGTYGGSPFMMLEFPTGKADTEVGQNAYNYNLIRQKHDASLEYAKVYWRSCYYGIDAANLAIKYIPDIAMNEEEKSRLMGEARFLRAYYYFILVRLFGDVPLLTEPVESLDRIYQSRTGQEKIYTELIVPDLQQAEKSGLPAIDPSGRVSMGAVKTLLAKVYLTMAGYPLQDESKFALARDKAGEVMKMGYDLFDDYDQLRDPLLDNQREHIFMTQYAIDISNTMVPQWLLPSYRGISAYADEFGSLFCTKEFYNSFDSGDKRAEERQFFYSSYPGHPSDWPEGEVPDNINLGNHYIYKYFDETAVLETAKSGKNWPLFRYAEVLLIFAEAQNEVEGGPDKAAYDAVNDVRKRAKLTDLSGLSKDEFRKAVWKERTFELCFENKMWYDMVRTHKVWNDKNRDFDDFEGHVTSLGITFSKDALLFPIPKRELDNNPNLKPQNPGY